MWIALRGAVGFHRSALSNVIPTEVIQAAGGLVWRTSPRGRELILIHRTRYGPEWALSKGKLDPGEDAWLCAQRELLEETGYTARQWARAGVLHPVIAYSTEVIEIWFAKDLTLGERQLDKDEFLDVFNLDALGFARAHEITDCRFSCLFITNLADHQNVRVVP